MATTAATTGAPEEPPPKIRISLVGGRHLIFDLSDVMRLRRSHSMCSVLVGTTPQAPNQNVFCSLPLELFPEEAALLVGTGAAVIVDGRRAHVDGLVAALSEPATRLRYVEAHRARRAALQSGLDEEVAARSRASEAIARAKREAAAASSSSGGKGKGKSKGTGRGKRRSSGSGEDTGSAALVEEPTSGAESAMVAGVDEPVTAGGLFEVATPPVPGTPRPTAAPKAGPPALTPATTAGLDLLGGTATILGVPEGQGCPLYNRLNSLGYFMTPGIRFGGRYSVYPGDPFRFHAHFVADSYGWDDEVGMLDLVGTGRLAGAVKKGLLLGAERPGGGAGDPDGKNVRAFCVEWAGM